MRIGIQFAGLSTSVHWPPHICSRHLPAPSQPRIESAGAATLSSSAIRKNFFNIGLHYKLLGTAQLGFSAIRKKHQLLGS
jgi:hypothetical protein